VLPEANSARAIHLRDESKNGIHERLAPDIFTAEIPNGLAAAKRQGRIKPGESAVFVHDILRAAPALYPTPPLLLRAMAVAIATWCAVYDCISLALAKAEGCELVTADDPLACGLRPTYPFIVPLVALP
jgi:predicted nucleic acid-binding protein